MHLPTRTRFMPSPLASSSSRCWRVRRTIDVLCGVGPARQGKEGRVGSRRRPAALPSQDLAESALSPRPTQGMDRLSLLASAVTQPDQAMHHPLAGVGHPGAGPTHSGSPTFAYAPSQAGPAPPQPYPSQTYAAQNPYPHGFAHPQLASASPNSPDSGGTSASGSNSRGKKAVRRTSQMGDDELDGNGHDADGQPAKKKTKQSLSCGECKVCFLLLLATVGEVPRLTTVSLLVDTCRGGRSR